MTQVNSSPGVPKNLATVTSNQSTGIYDAPPGSVSSNIVGTGVISTNGVLYWVNSTGCTNLYPVVATQSARVVSPFKSSTPIVLPNQVSPGGNL